MSTVTVRALADGRVLEGGWEMLAAKPAASAVWVDILAPDQADLDRLASAFELHPLALEDCLHFPQRPKIESYGRSLFLVWAVPAALEADHLVARELEIFLGHDWILTVHREPLHAVERVAAETGVHLARGVEWTLHALLDLTVDDVLQMLDAIGEELSDVEDRMLERADPADLARLLRARRMLVSLHKTIAPERDIIRELVREEALVSAEAYRYFQDVGDHLARVEDALDTYREVASGAMDVYLSSVNNRMNAIMKQLTVVATIFLPLTLISGIYGMNVTVGMWPPVESAWSFWAVVAGMVMLASAMAAFFTRRKWW